MSTVGGRYNQTTLYTPLVAEGAQLDGDGCPCASQPGQCRHATCMVHVELGFGLRFGPQNEVIVSIDRGWLFFIKVPSRNPALAIILFRLVYARKLLYISAANTLIARIVSAISLCDLGQMDTVFISWPRQRRGGRGHPPLLASLGPFESPARPPNVRPWTKVHRMPSDRVTPGRTIAEHLVEARRYVRSLHNCDGDSHNFRRAFARCGRARSP